MFQETKIVTTEYTRNSKEGRSHTYKRNKTVAIFRCDNCDSLFERELGKMDHRRLSNGYFHVCPKCNPKKFAQEKGAERRSIWDLPVDSELDIGKI